MKPKTTGAWWMRSSETEGDWNMVEIILKNGILMVDDAYLGIVALDDYHENLIDIEWKPDN